VADPEVDDAPERSRFEVHLDGQLGGFAEYRDDDAVRSLTHTEVDDAFEGRGLGSALVRGALDATRAAGKAVLPFCPFVRSYIDTHPEYLDLVPGNQRARFDLPES
jgi:predicted GNAT family acetyltransferase